MFEVASFMPHGHCYLWRGDILWTHLISDLMIGLSYMVIPAILILFLIKRPEMPYRGIFKLFIAFIISCGVTHFFSIFTIWHPYYGWEAVLKAITAAFSIVTAVVIFRLRHVLVKLPTPQDIQNQAEELYNLKLKDQIAEETIRRQELVVTASRLSTQGLLIADKQGVIQFVNSAVNRIFEYEEGELIGQPVENLIPFEIREPHKEWISTFVEHGGLGIELNQGRFVEGVSRFGRMVKAEVTINVDPSSENNYFYTNILDVGVREEARARIEQERNRFQRISESIPEGIFEYQVDAQEFWFSEKAVQLLGLSDYHREVSLQDLVPVLNAETAQLFGDKLNEVTQHHSMVEFEMTHQGQVLEVVLSRIDQDGHLITGTLNDVTEKTEIKKEIRSQKEILQKVYDHMEHGIFILDIIDGEFWFSQINHVIRNVLGYELTEGARTRVSDLAPQYMDQDSIQQMLNNYQRCVDLKKLISYEERLTMRGKETWWMTHLHPILNDEDQVISIVGSTTLITEVKETQKKLDESSRFLSTVLDSSLSGTYIYDLTSNTNNFINKRYTEITGYQMSDLAEIKELSILFHPEEVDDVYKHMAEVSKSKDPLHLKYRFKHKDGHWIWCYSIDLAYQFNAKGEMTHFLGSFIDITDFVQTTDKLRQSNVELERFAYAASHDLQEPLRKMMAFSTILEDKINLTLDDESQYAISRIKDASSRMSQLISGILNLSKVGSAPLEIEKTSLFSIINITLDMIRDMIQESQAKIVLRVKDIEIGCETRLMIDVFQNILINSIKYTKPGEIPHIEISSEINEDYVILTFVDQGIGFDSDMGTNIFEPFKRLVTRNEVSGSGLGLALCKKVIDLHDGEIWADSVLGEGTSISVKLHRTVKV